MTLRRVRSAALLAALAATAIGATGCASGREANAGREGRPQGIGHLAYEVYLTRQLNLKDPEDAAYFQGPEAPPGYAYFGVFVSVCNQQRGGPGFASAPVGNFKIVDTTGEVFFPTPLPASNVWAYQPTFVNHRQCTPVAGSPAAEGPTGGGMLLFKIPIQSIENRPFDLVIHGPPGQATGRSVGVARIELDI